MKTKSKKVKLIPPDPKHCQKKIRTGCWPDARHFMRIGPAEEHDCGKKPSHIVRETKPDTHGQRGAMSLCPSCLAEFIEWKSGDLSGYKIEEIHPTRKET